MIHIATILVILTSHFIGDFLFQTHQQASNKYKCNKALGAHVSTYTLTIMVFGVILLPFWLGIIWALVNGVLHFFVDYTTSRINSKLWTEKRWHDFFVGVGCDQQIHYICLFSTYLLLS